MPFSWTLAHEPDYLGRRVYTLEGVGQHAEVTHDTTDNTFAVTYLEQFGEVLAPADAARGIGHALRLVETALLAHFLDVAKGLTEPLGVNVESAAVEVIDGSKGKAGYGDGWLRVREGKTEPKSYTCDRVYLDGDRVANCHPFIPADARLAAELGVAVGTRVAGVRWTEPA